MIALIYWGRKMILAAMAWCVLVPASASSFVPYTYTGLFQEANVVVWGQVAHVAERAVKGEPRTRVAITVKERWKGSSRKLLMLEQPQGSEDGVTQEVPGLPAFRAGEEVILFLVVDEENHYAVVGGKQGKLTVSTDPATGGKFIRDNNGALIDLRSFHHHLETGEKPAEQAR